MMDNVKAFHRNVRPFWVMDIHAQASKLEDAGHDVCHLEAGLPQFSSPKLVRLAAHEALTKYSLAYTPAIGLPALREQIAHHYSQKYHTKVSPDEVVITVGSSGAFQAGFLGAFCPGSSIAIFEPCYPAYRNILHALDFDVVTIALDESNGLRPTYKDLQKVCKHKKIDGLVLASPANPTGAVIARDELKNILTFCDRNQIRIIADEIYHGLEWNMQAHSLREFSNRHVVINSFSKYFSMTGWRVGWMLVPNDLKTNIINLQSNLFICAPAVSQYAAIAAFDCMNELETYKQIYHNNRDVLLKELLELSIKPIGDCDGAFYIYADVSALTNDSTQWCLDLLQKTGVALAPGEDFDLVNGKRRVRLSFARSHEEILKAIGKLKQYLHE